MRLKNVILGAALAAMTVTGSAALADTLKPGEGITVKPARATWDTGFFRKPLFDAVLKRLGMMSKSLRHWSIPSFIKPSHSVTLTIGPMVGSNA